MRNTLEVKLWFNEIKNSKKNSFIKFYIVGFSPSVSKDRLTNAINLASTVTTIKKNVIDTIHSRKTISFNNNEIWVKVGNSVFDITMQSFDEAEVSELVGKYFLDILKIEFAGKKRSNCTETMVLAVLKICLDLSWSENDMEKF